MCLGSVQQVTANNTKRTRQEHIERKLGFITVVDVRTDLV
jgi:hypothetical protein